MKQPRLVSTLVLSALFASTAALADNQRGFFAGGNLSYVMADDLVTNDSVNDDLNLGALEILGGYKFNAWLGADVRVGVGVGDSTIALVETGENTYSIDGYTAVYYRPEIMNPEAKLYGLIGFASVDASAESFDAAGNLVASGKLSESGLSVGLGAGWYINDNMNFNVEYRVLLNSDVADLNAVTAGIDYRF